MANSDAAQFAIDAASDSGTLAQAIVVGKGDDGKVQLFLADCDKEKLIVLLERARDKLVRSLDG